MLNDPFRTEAFANQLVLHDQAVGNHPMRQPERNALGELLERRPKPVCFAFRGDTGRDPREVSSGHSENVRIEAVCMDHIDPVLLHVPNQPPQLLDEIPIIKAGERVLVDFSESKLLGLSLQRAAVLQARDAHAAAAAFMQLAQELERLPLAAALLEAINNEQYVRLHNQFRRSRQERISQNFGPMTAAPRGCSPPLAGAASSFAKGISEGDPGP